MVDILHKRLAVRNILVKEVVSRSCMMQVLLCQMVVR